LIKIILRWLPFAVLATIICGLVYATVQQNYRQSANDPQIQMAEDTVNALNGGQPADSVIPKNQVDISKSLAPFVIIYKENVQVSTSSAILDGLPNPPSGIFDFVKIQGFEWFTWQPRQDLRFATVVQKYNGGYVLAARSIREVEKREIRMSFVVLAAWLVSLAGTFIALLISPLFKKLF